MKNILNFIECVKHISNSKSLDKKDIEDIVLSFDLEFIYDERLSRMNKIKIIEFLCLMLETKTYQVGLLKQAIEAKKQGKEEFIWNRENI